jgi:hypothetical protein
VTEGTYHQLIDEARAALRAVRREVIALRLHLALGRLAEIVRKANFNPAQLRIPAGQPGGGQWAGGEDGDVHLVGARGRTSVTVRVGSRTLDATPAQAARYAISSARARISLREVREIDPSWSPRPSLTDPNSIEGQIRRTEAEAREAQARLAELTRARFGDNQGPPLDPLGPRAGTGTPSLPPFEAIGSYRSITGMPDIGLGPAGPKTDDCAWALDTKLTVRMPAITDRPSVRPQNFRATRVNDAVINANAFSNKTPPMSGKEDQIDQECECNTGRHVDGPSYRAALNRHGLSPPHQHRPLAVSSTVRLCETAENWLSYAASSSSSVPFDPLRVSPLAA